MKWLRVLLRSEDGAKSRRNKLRYGSIREYATQLEPAPSEERYSRQLDNGYARYLMRHENDNVSSISASPMRLPRFGGILPRYRNEFGRRPSTRLTSGPNEREDDKVPKTNTAAGDVQASDGQGRRVGRSEGYTRYLPDNVDGIRRRLSRRGDDVDDASSVHSVHSGAGSFGRMSRSYRNVFGVGPSTLLAGGRGFLTSSIVGDDVDTNVGEGVGVGDGNAAASHANDGGGSVWERMRNWLRQRDSRRQAPRDHEEMELRGVEPEQRPAESSV